MTKISLIGTPEAIDHNQAPKNVVFLKTTTTITSKRQQQNNYVPLTGIRTSDIRHPMQTLIVQSKQTLSKPYLYFRAIGYQTPGWV